MSILHEFDAGTQFFIFCYNHTCNEIAVTTQVFGCRMNNNVSPEF